MSLQQLYQNMLAVRTADPLSPQMQERIYRHCIRSKDVTLLVALAKYRHLDPVLDDLIKAHDDLRVIVAWATRPNRTSEELTERLLSDKRVAVLKPLAEVRGLPAEVYETIAKVDSANLAEILAGNPSAPLHVRITKIREHVRRAPRGADPRHTERLHALCKDPVGPNGEIGAANHAKPMYEAVAETTLVPPYVLACLTKPYVRETDLDRWIDNFEAIAANAGTDWNGLLPSIISLIAAQTGDDARRGSLIGKVQAHVARIGQNYRANAIQAALAKIVSTDPETETMFRTLIDTTDPAQAAEMVQTIRARSKSNDDLARLAGIVARHDHVPAALAVELLPLMQRGQDDRVLYARLEREGDYDSLLSIVEQGKNAGYMPTVLHYVGDQRTLMLRMIERCRAAGRTLPAWAASTELVRENPTIAAEMLSWKQVSDSLGVIGGLARIVEERILAALGDDQSRWESFNGLADGFDGNLDDLLGAATTLSV